jgi:RNA polymerase sigma-70 factor (sigma-E family)
VHQEVVIECHAMTDDAAPAEVGRQVEVEFEQWVATRWRWLLRAGWLLTGDWAGAEDLVQSTLARTWAAWLTVRSADEPDAYVRRMLTNEFLGQRRRRSATETPRETLPDDVSPDRTVDVDRRLALTTALAELPSRQRAAVVLRYFADLSLEQTAAALGCSVGTAKSQTSRGLDRLRGSAHLSAYLPEVP